MHLCGRRQVRGVTWNLWRSPRLWICIPLNPMPFFQYYITGLTIGRAKVLSSKESYCYSSAYTLLFKHHWEVEMEPCENLTRWWQKKKKKSNNRVKIKALTSGSQSEGQLLRLRNGDPSFPSQCRDTHFYLYFLQEIAVPYVHAYVPAGNNMAHLSNSN